MKIKSPSPQLKEYVKYYWSLDYKHSSKEEQGIIPTGLAEIYFHFENLPTIGNNEVNSQLFLSKPSLKPHKILLEGHISFVAVALYPHTPMLLFEFPQDYFSQGTIPLNLTADNSWAVLHNKVYDLSDFDYQVNLIEEYLTGRIYQAKRI